MVGEAGGREYVIIVDQINGSAMHVLAAPSSTEMLGWLGAISSASGHRATGAGEGRPGASLPPIPQGVNATAAAATTATPIGTVADALASTKSLLSVCFDAGCHANAECVCLCSRLHSSS